MTRARSKATLLLGAALLVSFAGAQPLAAPPDQASALKPGSPAPLFSLRDLAGKPLDLASYKGKVVLLDFWATWCIPCREEIPHFVELQKRYGDRGLAIIGISMDDTPAPVQAFVAKLQMNYPVAMGDAALADKYGGILGLPVAFVIDRQGIIRSKFEGLTKVDVFEKAIVGLLGK